MNKFLLIIFLLPLFEWEAFAQGKNVEPENGYNIFYYPNGQISSEGNMIDGEPDGIWKAYYVNGVIKSIGKRLNVQLDSVWVFYNEDGNIKEKINYLDGNKNGYYYSFEYFRNNYDSIVGYLASQELFVNNKRNGISEYYYSDGSIKTAINYKDGLKHGLAREYNSNGIITAIIEYKEGREIDREIINQQIDTCRIGVWKEFYPNGKLKIEQSYLDCKLNGFVKYYDLSGVLIRTHRYELGNIQDTNLIFESAINIKEEFYQFNDEKGEPVKKFSGGYNNGVAVGVHRTYDSVGRVNSSKLYDDQGLLIAEGIVNEEGDKLGQWNYYYANGAIKSQGSYRDNRRVDNWNYYYENGKIEQKGIFKIGVPHGLWTWYHENGAVKREEFYELGLENGESIEYDEQGTVIAKGEYVDGLKEGTWYFNYYLIYENGLFKNDFKQGIWKYYYASGQLYFEGNFVQDYEDGKHIYYYKNNKIKEVRYYILGRKDKNWEYYDYYGTLIKIRTFENNELVKIDGVSVQIE